MYRMSSVADLFASKKNKAYLLSSMNKVFEDHEDQLKIISNNFDDFFKSAVRKTYAEASTSDPVPWMTEERQLSAYNQNFIRDLSGFLVSLNKQTPMSFSLSESGAESSVATYDETPDELLAKWRKKPINARSVREDPAIDFGFDGKEGNTSGGFAPTIDFCDQDSDNMQQHLAWLQGGYRGKFNKQGSATDFVGSGTEASNNRLLSRRIFRTEGGIENGIPRRQIKRRYYERDQKESFSGIEREAPIRGYNMTSLRNLVDAKNAHKKCNVTA